MKVRCNKLPIDKAKEWGREDMYDRVQKCRVMLLLHGFLSPRENENVIGRINTWMEDKGFEVSRSEQ